MCEWNFKKFPLFLALQCFMDVILLKEQHSNVQVEFKKNLMYVY